MKLLAILALCSLAVVCLSSDATSAGSQPASDNPAQEGVFVERDQAAAVVRQKRVIDELPFGERARQKMGCPFERDGPCTHTT
ncbi:osteocalcin-like [Lampris incognitus]|uniref:osteocalcin-like n=1 Tax=Lampris incognitus TaxID=2546036 RepID=UPI0024B509FF|nr:osteocalcin-like [Lampris incognitus]